MVVGVSVCVLLLCVSCCYPSSGCPKLNDFRQKE